MLTGQLNIAYLLCVGLIHFQVSSGFRLFTRVCASHTSSGISLPVAQGFIQRELSGRPIKPARWLVVSVLVATEALMGLKRHVAEEKDGPFLPEGEAELL